MTTEAEFAQHGVEHRALVVRQAAALVAARSA